MNPDLTFILQNIAATLKTEWNGKVCPFRAPVETQWGHILPSREGGTQIYLLFHIYFSIYHTTSLSMCILFKF